MSGLSKTNPNWTNAVWYDQFFMAHSPQGEDTDADSKPKLTRSVQSILLDLIFQKRSYERKNNRTFMSLQSKKHWPKWRTCILSRTISKGKISKELKLHHGHR